MSQQAFEPKIYPEIAKSLYSKIKSRIYLNGECIFAMPCRWPKLTSHICKVGNTCQKLIPDPRDFDKTDFKVSITSFWVLLLELQQLAEFLRTRLYLSIRSNFLRGKENSIWSPYQSFTSFFMNFFQIFFAFNLKSYLFTRL